MEHILYVSEIFITRIKTSQTLANINKEIAKIVIEIELLIEKLFSFQLAFEYLAFDNLWRPDPVQ